MSIYSDSIERILDLPVWMKEALYFLLKDNLQKTLPYSKLEDNIENVFQYSFSELTYMGKKKFAELKEENNSGLLFKFLDAVMQKQSILEFTLNNELSLEEAATVYCDALEQSLINLPANTLVHTKALYFANKIRIGEYLKRIGVVDVNQIELAQRTQKKLDAEGTPKKFVHILIEQGAVSQTDTDAILLLKSESRKPYIIGKMQPARQNDKETKELLDKLIYENKLLKTKLRDMLNS